MHGARYFRDWRRAGAQRGRTSSEVVRSHLHARWSRSSRVRAGVATRRRRRRPLHRQILTPAIGALLRRLIIWRSVVIPKPQEIVLSLCYDARTGAEVPTGIIS